jgi:hypothetical protein
MKKFLQYIMLYGEQNNLGVQLEKIKYPFTSRSIMEIVEVLQKLWKARVILSGKIGSH